MSQTAYSIEAAAAFAGMQGHPNADAYIESKANEDAALAKFGYGYALGTDPVTQFAAFDGAGTFAGVLVHRHQTQQRAAFAAGGTGGATGLVQNEVGDLMRKGRVWVETNEAVTAGVAAYVVNDVADHGKFRTDNTNAQAVAGTFRTSVGAAGIALLELNEP